MNVSDEAESHLFQWHRKSSTESCRCLSTEQRLAGELEIICSVCLRFRLTGIAICDVERLKLSKTPSVQQYAIDLRV